MDSQRRRMVAEALASPPLSLSDAPVSLVRAGTLSLPLRVPPRDYAYHRLIRIAHATATARSGGGGGGGSGKESGSGSGASERYQAAMREECGKLLDEQPIYWSELWPGGLALAHCLLQRTLGEALVEGKTVLELGTGLGVGAVAAALAGARSVLATDLEPCALDFVRQSAADNGVSHRVRALQWDHYQPPPSELGGATVSFDVVLGGDVMYEDDAAERLARLLPTLVPYGGVVIISDGLDRPYREEHAERLRTLLRNAEFVEQSCCDVDVDMKSAVTRPAAPRVDGEERSWSCTRVRLAVFTRSRSGDSPPGASLTCITADSLQTWSQPTKLGAGPAAVSQGTLTACGLVELWRGEADGTTSWRFAAARREAKGGCIESSSDTCDT